MTDQTASRVHFGQLVVMQNGKNGEQWSILYDVVSLVSFECRVIKEKKSFQKLKNKNMR